MRIRLKAGLALVLWCVIITACTPASSVATGTSEDTPRATATGVSPSLPADTAAPSATATPMPTPTATMEATETPLPLPTTGPTSEIVAPTPSLPLIGGTIYQFGDFFFDTGAVSNCVLPCWRGLVLGKSGPQDVQDLFDTVFGFNHSVNFFAPTPQENIGLGVLNIDATKVPDLYGRGYRWDIGQTNFQNFAFVSGFQKTTNKLVVAGFHWETTDSSKFEIVMSPQEVIRELGKPSQVLAGVEGLLPGDIGLIRFKLIYDQGLIFEFLNEGPISITYVNSTNGSIKDARAQFCLGNTRTIEGIEHIMGTVSIVPHFANGLVSLAPIQSAILDKDIAWNRVKPVEEIFEASIDHITELALHQSNPCLRSKNLLGP